MKLMINESTLNETLDDIKKYYPNIDDDTFMKLIALDPTYTGKDSAGKYGKWLLNLYNRGMIFDNDFDEITPLLNQFKIYRNRIQNKDLNSYKTLDDLAQVLASVVDDDSMLTPRQKVRFLKNVKSGKVSLDKSDDYDVVLNTPKFIVYVPNTHEASMKLGKDTEWCTAHENPKWYNSYTENGHKLYIIKDKETGERWQYSDKNGDFLNEDDMDFIVSELMHQDEKLSKFFEKFLGIDYYNFNGTWIYTGEDIPSKLKHLIENVVVENGVTSIDDEAFSNCESLKSIKIPNSVTSIGNNAFYYCESLTSITIPNSVESIDRDAFYGCESLLSIIIPNSVTSIGKNAFNGCKSLKSVIISNNVTSIGKGMFFCCESLTNITIPDSVTSIGVGAFEDCKSLTNVTIPDSVTNIGKDAFNGCERLASITIPNSVTSIGNRTFMGCKNLSSIVIPNSVEDVGVCAFCDCSSLKSITISDSVTSIDEDAFYNCENLTVYTNNDYVINYCDENDIPVRSLKSKNESFKLKIKEF